MQDLISMNVRGSRILFWFLKDIFEKRNPAANYEKKKNYKRRTAEETATFASVIESLETVQLAVFPVEISCKIQEEH